MSRCQLLGELSPSAVEAPFFAELPVVRWRRNSRVDFLRGAGSKNKGDAEDTWIVSVAWLRSPGRNSALELR